MKPRGRGACTSRPSGACACDTSLCICTQAITARHPRRSLQWPMRMYSDIDPGRCMRSALPGRLPAGPWPPSPRGEIRGLHWPAQPPARIHSAHTPTARFADGPASLACHVGPWCSTDRFISRAPRRPCCSFFFAFCCCFFFASFLDGWLAAIRDDLLRPACCASWPSVRASPPPSCMGAGNFSSRRRSLSLSPPF